MLSIMPPIMRFIADLVGWIESHLESPLMISDVTAKSGYSKWHLQRMFKKETGISLGTYIRNRRLSQAAVELKLTSQTIQEVALRYCFDSQQSFTRTFKKHFGTSPGHYRKQSSWDFSSLQPSLRPNVNAVPVPEVVALPRLPANRCHFEYTQVVDDLVQVNDIARRPVLWEKACGRSHAADVSIYVSSTVYPDDNRIKRQVRVNYDVGVITHAEELLADDDGIGEQGTDVDSYLRFRFIGNLQEYQTFLRAIYHHILPGRPYTKMGNNDVEIVRCRRKPDGAIDTSQFEVDYFIPFNQIARPSQSHEQRVTAA